MEIPISEAADQLDDLVTLVEAGEEVILTIDGRPAGKLVKYRGRENDLS